MNRYRDPIRIAEQYLSAEEDLRRTAKPTIPMPFCPGLSSISLLRNWKDISSRHRLERAVATNPGLSGLVPPSLVADNREVANHIIDLLGDVPDVEIYIDRWK